MKTHRLPIRALSSMLFVLSIMLCLLPRADASPAGVSVVTFSNQGGYVARYWLCYVVEGQFEDHLVTEYTGSMSLGMTKSYPIPDNVTEVYVKAEAWFLGWSTIPFKQDIRFREGWIPTGQTTYIKTFGSSFAPRYDVEYFMGSR